MIDPYTLSVLLFFGILAIVIYRDRKNIDFKYILIMRRTKKFRKLIDNIAKASPRFWKVIGTFGILICFFYMIQGTFLLTIFQPKVQLVLPSLSPEISVSEVSINIPFWTWFIVILFILVPHELFHGIMARADKIRLKSVGLMMLAIFPGAFVEPDEKQVKKSKIMTRLRVFAAGSFANFIVSFTIFFFTLLLLWPSITYPGIIITDVDLSGPAALAGITPGMILSEINAIPITTTYNEYLNNTGYFYEEVGYLEIGDIIVVETIDNQIFEVELSNKTIEFYNETSEKDELFNATYMGINYSPRYKFAQSSLPFIIQLLTLVSFFSLAVGIINILPIYPLDGGLMVEAITDKYAKKRSKQIVKMITFFVLIILLYSFFKPFL
jgi:membrane-associated protease RseP (regulator of RpoE activity)